MAALLVSGVSYFGLFRATFGLIRQCGGNRLPRTSSIHCLLFHWSSLSAAVFEINVETLTLLFWPLALVPFVLSIFLTFLWPHSRGGNPLCHIRVADTILTFAWLSARVFMVNENPAFINYAHTIHSSPTFARHPKNTTRNKVFRHIFFRIRYFVNSHCLFADNHLWPFRFFLAISTFTVG